MKTPCCLRETDLQASRSNQKEPKSMLLLHRTRVLDVEIRAITPCIYRFPPTDPCVIIIIMLFQRIDCLNSPTDHPVIFIINQTAPSRTQNLRPHPLARPYPKIQPIPCPPPPNHTSLLPLHTVLQCLLDIARLILDP